MNNKRSFYRKGVPPGLALITLLLYCVVFMGCPEAAEMTEDVVLPPTETDPNVDPNTDPNVDPNVDPNADPNVDPAQ